MKSKGSEYIMKNIDISDYIPSKKEHLELFKAYFSKITLNKGGKFTQDLVSYISTFLKAEDFKVKNLKSFLMEIRKEDHRLYNNYKRAFVREGRIKRIKPPMEEVSVSCVIPKILHLRLVQYCRDNKTTIQSEMEKLIEKKVGSA